MPLEDKSINLRHHRRALAWRVVLILVLASCVVRAVAGPDPIDDPADLRTITANSLNSIAPTILTLESLGNLSGSCPPEVLVRMAINIDRVQLDSIRFRAHAAAIQLRGDAYFNEWQRHSAAATESEGGNRARDHHPLSQQSFIEIQRHA